jgi:hypothetical protein
MAGYYNNDKLIELENEVTRLRTELAAAQAREQQMREALRLLWNSEGAPDCDDLAAIDDALALPSDDSALRARLAQERERVAEFLDQRAEDYALEFGRGRDSEGGLSFGCGPWVHIRKDYYNELLENAGAVRAMGDAQ